MPEEVARAVGLVPPRARGGEGAGARAPEAEGVAVPRPAAQAAAGAGARAPEA
ncbi:MAG: hypothetical protein QOH64_3471, partial [Acidimicrobiaceae bacterium]